MPGITTNPNLGIGLGYDGGIAYGTNKNTAIGEPRAVSGNAGIYKEKSKYEKDLDQDRFEQDKEDDCDIEEFGVDIELQNKANTSSSQAQTDFGAKYGTDPFSYNGLANTSQYLGASYNRGENLLREFIQELLHEKDVREATSMSVRIMSKGTVGDPYKSSTANVSNVNQMSPGDPSIKQKGYYQSEKSSTDGGEVTNRLDDDISEEFDYYDEDYTTGKYLYDTTNKDYIDNKNVNNHKFNSNR
jgi:hypothetical protein